MPFTCPLHSCDADSMQDISPEHRSGILSQQELRPTCHAASLDLDHTESLPSRLTPASLQQPSLSLSRSFGVVGESDGHLLRDGVQLVPPVISPSLQTQQRMFARDVGPNDQFELAMAESSQQSQQQPEALVDPFVSRGGQEDFDEIMADVEEEPDHGRYYQFRLCTVSRAPSSSNGWEVFDQDQDEAIGADDEDQSHVLQQDTRLARNEVRDSFQSEDDDQIRDVDYVPLTRRQIWERHSTWDPTDSISNIIADEDASTGAQSKQVVQGWVRRGL